MISQKSKFMTGFEVQGRCGVHTLSLCALQVLVLSDVLVGPRDVLLSVLPACVLVCPRTMMLAEFCIL